MIAYASVGVGVRCPMQVMRSDRMLFFLDYPFENMDEAAEFLDNAPSASPTERSPPTKARASCSACPHRSKREVDGRHGARRCPGLTGNTAPASVPLPTSPFFPRRQQKDSLNLMR